MAGLSVTLPTAGWSSTEQDVGEFNLVPPGHPNDRLYFWEDLAAVKSTGAGHGDTVLSNVGTTPDALVSWLTSNPDFLVVARPASATIGNGIKTTNLTVGVSHTARYGDANCPSNPRCADLFTNPGLWHGAYGIGGDEEVHLYLTTIRVNGAAHTFMVALDATDDADLALLTTAARSIIDTFHLPTGVVAE